MGIGANHVIVKKVWFYKDVPKELLNFAEYCMHISMCL